MKRKYLLLPLVALILALPGCRIGSGPAPFAPSDLTGIAVAYDQIDLTWQDNSPDETGFYIYRKTTNSYSNIANIEANTTFYNDTALSPGTIYSYKLTAYNNGGESGPSNEVTITTPGEPTAPSAPSNLAGQAVSFSEIDLTWQDNSSNEEGFHIYRKTTDDYSIIATMEANATSYNNIGLNPETAYSYKVTAYNAIGESESSNAICITTPAETLEPPSNVMAEAVSYKQINLTWQDNSDDEDNFRITCDMGLGPGNNQFLARVPANTTHYEHGNLQPLTEYKYFVIAERGADEAGSERFWATTFAALVEIFSCSFNRVGNSLLSVNGQIQNNASESCQAEVTTYFYNPENGTLAGSGNKTFHLAAFETQDFGLFGIEVWVDEPLGIDYDYEGHWEIEITDVEIEY